MKKRLIRRALTLLCAGAVSFAIPACARLASGADTDAPGVATFSKNGLATDVISFAADDFQVEGDAALTSIVVNSLPDPNAGMLTIGDQAVPLDSEIATPALDGLRFKPLVTPTISATNFSFTPVFAGGVTGEDVTVGVYLLTAANEPPVAEELSLTTYKNVEVQGTFAGIDPEGDLLTFKLVSKPARGAVTQAQEGSAEFTYTPYEGKTGKDAFTYVAVDTVGNTSAPVTVSIKIEKQKTKVTYADMTGVEGHRSALRLAEAGLLMGEKMGDQYFFHPQQTMSRAQFTALAMAAAGMETLQGVTVTGFADDAAMDAWAKPYVSSALRSGVVRGTYDGDGRVVFQADAPITAAEAAVVLDRAIGVTDVVDVFASDVPAWCSQAVSNLDSCGALSASAELDAPLTRAQAAVMLDRALDVVASRPSGGWSLWG